MNFIFKENPPNFSYSSSPAKSTSSYTIPQSALCEMPPSLVFNYQRLKGTMLLIEGSVQWLCLSEVYQSL